MAVYFLDSSAVVKRYVAETGSGWVRGITDPAAGHTLYLVRITGVEVVSALVRHLPAIPPPQLAQALADFKHDFQTRYQLIAASDHLLLEAMRLVEQYRLRGYDAVQLAGAVELHAQHAARGLSLALVSADNPLNRAAALEGLLVENPLNHP